MSASIDVHRVKRINFTGVKESVNCMYRTLEIVLEDDSTVEVTLFAAPDTEDITIHFK
jgi:hypothetical protein